MTILYNCELLPEENKQKKNEIDFRENIKTNAIDFERIGGTTRKVIFKNILDGFLKY